ncbi:ferredoxin [Cycloclasticus sp. P1]|uniref:(2Fe-2S) ferredoxin domain-containing protein n=1 Tax=Cycloclasticus sp. (strain P1) TaxID=385025 RepID=UPI000286ABF4|nr:(2Fe-2S) ferredoxin domain-containing protein [Cycloclasticus sp. P1]AFT68019.1 Ferredoxin-like protein [Cycloclasticus sp. P1]
MAYYKQHVFFCTNQRSDGRASCQDHNAQEMRDYLKKKVKEAGLAGPGGVRVNNAGCLDRCGQGPVLVIYPDGVWYQYKTEEDIDDIFESCIRKSRVIKEGLS